MRNFLTLVKIETRGAMANSGQANQKKWLVYLFYAFLIVYFGFLGYAMSVDIIEELAELGLEKVFIRILMLGMFAFVIMTSFITAVMSNVNEGQTEYLNTMPISSRKRFMASFLAQLEYSYSYALLLGAVPLIFYGINQGMGMGYYIYSALAVLLMPILPTLIIYIIMFFIINVLKIFVSKKVFSWVSVILMFVFIILYSNVTSSVSGPEGTQELVNFTNNYANKWYTIYPNKLADIILNDKGLIIALKMLLLNVGIVVSIYYTIGTIYLKQKLFFADNLGALNIFAKFNKKKEKNKKVDLNSLNYNKKNPLHSYAKRDFSFFVKNPLVISQTIMIPIIMIIVMIIGFTSGLKQTMEPIKEDGKVYFTKRYFIAPEEYLKLLKEQVEPNAPVINNKINITDQEIYKLLTDEEKQKKTDEFNEIRFIPAVTSQGENTYLIEEYRIDAKPDIEMNEENAEFTEKDIKFPEGEKAYTILKEYDLDIKGKNSEEIDNLIIEDVKKQLASTDLTKEQLTSKSKRVEYDLKDIRIFYESATPFEALIKVRATLTENYENKESPLSKNWLYSLPIIISAVYSMFIMISIYSFSKDAGSYKFLKTIPIKQQIQYKIKRLPGLLIKIGFILFTLFAAEIIFKLNLLKQPIFYLGFTVAIIYAVMQENLQLLLDLRNPLTTWKNQNQLLKQGKVTLFILSHILAFVGIGIIYNKFVSKGLIAVKTFLAILTFIIVVLYLATEIYVIAKKDKLFEKLV